MAYNTIFYKSKEVLHVDYRMKSPAEMEEVLNDNVEYIRDVRAKGQDCLLMIDLRNVPVSDEFFLKLRNTGNANKKYVLKSAILGIHGIKKLFFQMYQLFLTDSKMKVFDEENEALEYLVTD